MEKMERPTLGTLRAGDPVFIRVPGRYINDDARFREATIINVKRVWITVRDGGPDRRFRLDTQDDGESRHGNGYSFVTPEQREYDERMAAERRRGNA